MVPSHVHPTAMLHISIIQQQTQAVSSALEHNNRVLRPQPHILCSAELLQGWDTPVDLVTSGPLWNLHSQFQSTQLVRVVADS